MEKESIIKKALKDVLEEILNRRRLISQVSRNRRLLEKFNDQLEAYLRETKVFVTDAGIPWTGTLVSLSYYYSRYDKTTTCTFSVPYRWNTASEEQQEGLEDFVIDFAYRNGLCPVQMVVTSGVYLELRQPVVKEFQVRISIWTGPRIPPEYEVKEEVVKTEVHTRRWVECKMGR